MTAGPFAKAIVASSLASSRTPSPKKPQLPPPRRHGKLHYVFHRNHSSDSTSRTPSSARHVKQTLRASKVTDQEELDKRICGRRLEKNPTKHHKGDRKRWRDMVFETERKCYEGL